MGQNIQIKFCSILKIAISNFLNKFKFRNPIIYSKSSTIIGSIIIRDKEKLVEKIFKLMDTMQNLDFCLKNNC